MRFVSRLFTAVILVAAAAPVAHAQRDRQMGGIGLEVFEDKNFNGRSATFLNDTPDLRPSGMDHRISSLRIAPGETWQVCTEPNYQGRCQVFSGTETDLAKRQGWNDAIVSVRRVSGGRGSGDFGRGSGDYGRGGPPFPPPGPGLRPRLVFFERTGFRGRSMTVSDDMPFARIFGGHPGSVRVIGRWDLCENSRFGGRCATVADDVPDLRRLPLRDGVGSLRVR